uniref:Uncharacterized protein n=1 Tax=Cliftonaea pectinata TaxID=2007206 RepID=A0A1Z1MQX0_9FLOR|nr:hypothetical protein [Cliftonaea pectinata]ARW68151.1 hypothetical protein [Cliftonaea pectinata]
MPIGNALGLVEKKDNNDLYRYSTLYISVRFQGRPLPINVKLHGVLDDNSKETDDLIIKCSYLYTEEFYI